MNDSAPIASATLCCLEAHWLLTKSSYRVTGRCLVLGYAKLRCALVKDDSQPVNIRCQLSGGFVRVSETRSAAFGIRFTTLPSSCFFSLPPLFFFLFPLLPSLSYTTYCLHSTAAVVSCDAMGARHSIERLWKAWPPRGSPSNQACSNGGNSAASPAPPSVFIFGAGGVGKVSLVCIDVAIATASHCSKVVSSFNLPV